MKQESAEKVQIGIVGVGKMGELHLSKYLQLADVNVVGIFDTDPKKALSVSQKFGVKVYQDLAALLFEVDAVIISTHTTSHFQNSKLALESGTHVLVEKPMCAAPEEARELVRLAEKNALVLQVGYQERFRLKRLTDHLHDQNVRFVDVHWLATELPREPTIDVISDLLVHPLDMVLSLIGSEIKTFNVTGAKILTSMIDLVSVRLEFQNGAAANLWISRVSSHRERRLYLFSSKEQASINFITNHIEVLRPSSGILEKLSFSLETGDLKPDVLLEQCASFVTAVKNGTPPLVSGRNGLKVLELADAVRRQIQGPSAREPQISEPRELTDGL